jgi:hypothetical protein
VEPAKDERLPFASYTPSELVARLIFHWLPENWSVPVAFAGRALPFNPVTVMLSVMEVVPFAVPVASPEIVNVMLWLPDMQVTVSATDPVEFAAVAHPCPVKDVTPVFA